MELTDSQVRLLKAYCKLEAAIDDLKDGEVAQLLANGYAYAGPVRRAWITLKGRDAIGEPVAILGEA